MEMTDYLAPQHRSSRRNSSIFIPQQPSILKQIANVISDTVKTISLRYGLRYATLTT